LAVPPGDCQWQGNSRLNNGGLGGRPIKYFQGFQTYEKLFFGGGGGAGHENDWVGGSGGDGGGFAIVIANQIIASSAASIQANGNPGQSSIPIATGPFDGSGGGNRFLKNTRDTLGPLTYMVNMTTGGAGGSVFVVAYESLSSNVQISAAGGRGGDNNALSTEEAEGGAGGGGGGVVSVAVPDASPNPCSSANVAGGLSGYQNGQTFFLTFRPNGGTDGNNGQCLAVTTAPPCITTGSPTMSPSVSSSGAASTVSASTKSNGGTSIVGGGAPSSGRTSGGGGTGGSSGANNGGKGNRTPSPHNKKNSRPSNNNHKNHHNNNSNDDESASAFVGINSCVIVVISLLVLLLQVQLY